MMILLDDDDYDLTPLSVTAAAVSLHRTTKILALGIVFSI